MQKAPINIRQRRIKRIEAHAKILAKCFMKYMYMALYTMSDKEN